MDPFADLALDEGPVGLFIDPAILEGSDEGGDGSFEHDATSLLEFL